MSQRSRAVFNKRKQSVRLTGGTRPAWAQQVGGLGAKRGLRVARPWSPHEWLTGLVTSG